MVPMMTTEHLLALFLFIGIPLRDMFETRALKTSTDPHRQILTYRRIAVVEWTAALVAWMPCDLGFSCSGPAPVTPLEKLDLSFVMGLVLAFTIGSLVQPI